MKKIKLPGYQATKKIMRLLYLMIFSPRVSGLRAAYLRGDPGSGKTALPRALAKGLDTDPIFYQCHSWTTDQELFVGINVAAAVSGDSAAIKEKGALLIAAEHSQSEKTVLIIDEIDKAPESVENLLLDFLQTGLVPVGAGEFVKANTDNLLVFVTSNEEREISQALSRRFLINLEMEALSPGQIGEILQAKGVAPMSLARLTARVFKQMADIGNFTSSLQEVENFLSSRELIEDKEDFYFFLESMGARGDSLLFNRFKKNKIVEELWLALK